SVGVDQGFAPEHLNPAGEFRMFQIHARPRACLDVRAHPAIDVYGCIWKTLVCTPGIDAERFERALLRKRPRVAFEVLERGPGFPGLRERRDAESFLHSPMGLFAVRARLKPAENPPRNPPNGPAAAVAEDGADVVAQPVFEVIAVAFL